MKKVIVYYIVSIVFFGLLSCKKGEDDPNFTLLGRKTRLSGEWKLTEGKMTTGLKSKGQKMEGHRFTFTKNRYVHDEVGKGAHFEGPSFLTLTIEKDGTISFSQQLDSISLRGAGAWDFIHKSQGLKNKEAIFVKLNSIMGYSGYFVTFNKSNGSFMYKIKELRNKKLVLVSDAELIDLDENGFGIYVESEYIFEQ
jgi:hypothetical protein